MTISEFIAKWRKVELKERSAAQEHFIDLCAVFEHPTPAAADPTGETFCFEKGAEDLRWNTVASEPRMNAKGRECGVNEDEQDAQARGRRRGPLAVPWPGGSPHL